MQPNSEQEDLLVFDNIMFYLVDEGCEYELLEHDHVHTSADAAKVRGTNLEEAAKALVLEAKYPANTKFARDWLNVEEHVDGSRTVYFMAIVSGHKRLNLKKLKDITGSKNVSLAHPDKVFEITGLSVGKVAPFPFMFNLDGFVDEGVVKNEYVVFSAASNFKSVRMHPDDWLGIVGVDVANIAQS